MTDSRELEDPRNESREIKLIADIGVDVRYCFPFHV